jgi:hypothetical protein
LLAGCGLPTQSQGPILAKQPSSFFNKNIIRLEVKVGASAGQIKDCVAPKWVFDQAQVGYWAYIKTDRFGQYEVLTVE